MIHESFGNLCFKQNSPPYVSTMKNIGVIGVITLGNPCIAFFLLLMMRSVMHPFEVLNILNAKKPAPGKDINIFEKNGNVKD